MSEKPRTKAHGKNIGKSLKQFHACAKKCGCLQTKEEYKLKRQIRNLKKKDKEETKKERKQRRQPLDKFTIRVLDQDFNIRRNRKFEGTQDQAEKKVIELAKTYLQETDNKAVFASVKDNNNKPVFDRKLAK